MTEIEKMFENANAYKMLCNCEFKNLYDYRIEYGQDICIHAEDEIRKGCEGCELAEQNVKYYPPFTAEKQLAIFKMFCGRYLEVSQHVEENGDLCFGIKATIGDFAVGFNKDFAECLADFVNCLWQYLTDQEKEEIRGILNE